jgi:hypothetical protein
MLVDSIEKFNMLAKIDKSNLKKSGLQAGDVMVKKVFEVAKGSAVEKAIIAGQKVFGKGDGSSKSEHLAMMLTPTAVVESEGDGVVCGEITKGDHAKTRYIVFRCRDSKVRDQAVLFGYQFMGFKREEAKPGAIKAGSYSISAAIKSVFKEQPLLEKTNDVKNATLCYDFMQFCDGKSNVRPDMFCSMFVAVVYESAAARLQNPKMFMGVNTAGMSPRAYEGMLLKNADKFTFAGVYGDVIA